MERPETGPDHPPEPPRPYLVARRVRRLHTSRLVLARIRKRQISLRSHRHLLQVGRPQQRSAAQRAAKPVVADSAMAGQTAGNAVDGRLETSWMPQAAPPSWLEVDFGRPVEIS